jgi:hypothetical protein
MEERTRKRTNMKTKIANGRRVGFMFSGEFPDMILRGEKRTTIRLRTVAAPGDALDFKRWEGRPYAKGSKRVTFAGTVCTFVHEIEISARFITLRMRDGRVTRHESFMRDWAARDDGFEDFDALKAWFRKNAKLPFRGVVVGWEPGTLKKPDAGRRAMDDGRRGGAKTSA